MSEIRALAACTFLSFVAVTGCAENGTADETSGTEAPAVATEAPSAGEEVGVPDGAEPSVTEPSAGGVAPGSVAVTITGVRGALGHDVAAVMFDGLGTEQPDARGIGGFGVEVDADRFSSTQTIATPSSIDVDTQFPYVSEESLVVEPGEYTITVWIAERLGPDSRWVPADSPGLGGCRMDVTVEEGRPTNVIVDGIPSWIGFAPECNTDSDVIPVAWEINLDDAGAGVHTVQMILDFGPMSDVVVEEMSGSLIWDQTEVALCGIDIRLFELEQARLRVGDIFQTTEGCGDEPTAMQDAFDEFGLPETACVAAGFDGTEHEYCARLPTTRSVDSADEGESLDRPIQW